VIKWAKERVEHFNASLDRHLGSVEPGSELWRECIDIVHAQAKVLGEVGVDFGGIVAKGLGEGGVGQSTAAVAAADSKPGRPEIAAPDARSVPPSSNLKVPLRSGVENGNESRSMRRAPPSGLTVPGR